MKTNETFVLEPFKLSGQERNWTNSSWTYTGRWGCYSL